MNKRVSKKLVVAGLVVTMMLCAVGCGKKMKCDGCGEEKTCKKYEVLGEEAWFCEDCGDDIKALQDAFK